MPEIATIWNGLAGTDLSVRHVDVGGVSTRVLEAGAGPTLVFSNGFTGHIEAYARAIPLLAPHFHVVCYDAIGQGFTDKPDLPYTASVYADHLLGLLDALAIERAFLSGLALGCLISARLAAAHPERVARLVLNTPGNVTAKPEVMRSVAEGTRKAVAEPTPETVRPRLEWLLAPGNRWMVTDELVDVRIAIYGQPELRETLENTLVMQDPEVRDRYTWKQDWCSEIEAPTLIISTSDDPSGKPEEARLLESWIPDSSYTVVDEGGHWLQWEFPQTLVRIHREFLLGETP